MFRFGLVLFVAVVQAQREVCNVASNRRYTANGSNGHITVGRVSLSKSPSPRLTIVLPDSTEEPVIETSDLDTSQWFASTDHPVISGKDLSGSDVDSTPRLPRFAGRWGRQPQRAKLSPALPVSVRTRLRKQNVVEELPSETMETTSDRPSPDQLEKVTLPLVPADVWTTLTGWEFDTPSTVEALAKTGLDMATRHSKNEWIDWKAADKTTSHVQDGDVDEQEALENGDVLVYLGKFRKEGYGSQLPLVKTRSILPMSPQELAELLMDSSRVQVYNKMSLGRTDLHVMQQGLGTIQGPFGDGESKIVRNLTKPPLTKKKMEFVTMMHARPLRPDDGVESGGYLVTSRAVGGKIWGGADEEFTRNEILLGVNLIQTAPSGDPDECFLTSVTHVYSPSVPVMLAGKVGVKGAIDFIKDIRNLCQPVAA